MASIYPFRAWRYNPAAVKLDDVVTQPYDKISPAMQQAYYQRSPYNLVRIILGLPELFDAERGESVYTRAARDLRAWREQGILMQEKDPCIFAYAQRFKVPGSDAVKERRGFIALGKLHDYAEQVVFRHEYTLSKPKSDRLNLLKATHAHFGQIFMLYSDPAGSVEKILYDNNGPAEAEVTDEYGVLHRLWRVSDPAAIRLLTTAMADKKMIIADGHHRYETALNYAKEHHHLPRQKRNTASASCPIPRFPGGRHDDLRQYGFRRPGDSAHPSRRPQPGGIRFTDSPTLPGHSSTSKHCPWGTPLPISPCCVRSKARPLSP